MHAQVNCEIREFQAPTIYHAMTPMGYTPSAAIRKGAPTNRIYELGHFYLIRHLRAGKWTDVCPVGGRK